MTLRIKKKNFILLLNYIFLQNIYQKNEIIQNRRLINSNNKKFEDLFYNDTIGSAAGQLYDIQNSRFNVIRLGGIVSEQAKNKLETKEGLEIYFVGRNRTDMYTQYDTQYLNNQTVLYNTYIAPGKSTLDIGIAAAAGKNIGFEENVVTLGLDLRSVTIWGKPQSPEATSKALLMHKEIATNTQLQNHIHTLEIPLIYLRGIDLTIDINKLFFNLSDKYPQQKLKLGMFPFEIGRGISLGAVYKQSSELLSYMAVDSISEFAPGFLLQGDLLKNSTLHYKLYTGIIKNFTGKQNQPESKISLNKQHGLFNIISALQVDWKYNDNDEERIVVSPYLIGAHEGFHKATSNFQDSTTNLMTYGIAIEGEKYNEWEIAFEFAMNNGTQYFFEVDNNTIIQEQYICPITGINNIQNINTSINVLTNSDVIFNGYLNDPRSRTTNIKNNNAIFFGEGSRQQNAIDNIYKNSTSNNKIITINNNLNSYTIQNSNTRFQDAYKNLYRGFMTVFDLGKYIHLCNKKCKLAFATGFASGDSISTIYNNKNKINTYNGFISLQGMYAGKMVMSAFLMNGIKNNQYGFNSYSPTEYSLLTQTSSSATKSPSPFNGFTNIMYSGLSLLIPHEGISYIWKWWPNILVYAQPYANPTNTDMQPKSSTTQQKRLSPFLGTEVNIFLEVISQNIDVFKIFFVGSLLFPGQYYKDFAKFNLDKTNLNYPTEYIKLQQNIIGYSVNIGIEFYF